MKRICKASFICLLLILSIFMVSCSDDDGTGYLFRYTIYNDPKNLDPQMATDTESLNIISNMFEGLVKVDSKGNVNAGAAQSYNVSSDGLTYTFNLHKDMYWKSQGDYKENVTADDFVFSFERLATKSTVSPHSEDYFCIKNFRQVYEGTMNMSQLGVKAVDKYKITITLEHPYAEFLNLLAQPSSFPCKRDFFSKSKGMYGLEIENVAANGPFYLKQWEYDPYGKNNYVILRKNQYFKTSDVYPSGLNYFVNKSRTDAVKDYEQEETDCIIDDGKTKGLFGRKSLSKSYKCISSGIVFNPKDTVFSNPELRKAMLLAINRKEIKDIPDYLSTASGIVPPAVSMLNKSYRELVSDPCQFEGKPSVANYMWMSTLTANQKDSLSDITLIVSEKFATSQEYKKITEMWKENLGVYCPVEILPENEYKSRIESGKFRVAVAEIRGNTNSPSAFLENFKTGNSGNMWGYSDASFDALLNKAETSETVNKAVDNYTQAEKVLVDKAYFIPVYYAKDYLIYNKNMTGIEYNPFSQQLIFMKAKKN